jgi:hypothetical protein
MTRPLRQIHRRVWMVLGIALPVLFVAALAARPPAPSNPALHWTHLP